jgi:alcohol dehydrogenase class IV
MSFIELKGIDDVSELPYASEGRYDLVVTSSKLKDSSDGEGKNILVVVEIENADRKYAPIFTYLGLPRGDDKDKDHQRLLGCKRFFHQFGIPMDNGVELEQMVGARAQGNVAIDEYQGENKNVLKVDRLPIEG